MRRPVSTPRRLKAAQIAVKGGVIGHAGIRQAWQSFKVDLQLKARYDDIRDLGDSVLALGELTGTGRITGLNVSNEIAQLATFRDRRILSFRDFASHAEALEAVGLSE